MSLQDWIDANFEIQQSFYLRYSRIFIYAIVLLLYRLRGRVMMYINPFLFGHPITTKPPFCFWIKHAMFGHLDNSEHTINQSIPHSGLQMSTQIVFGMPPCLKNEQRLNPLDFN
jgi:hypothetical protein